MTINRRFPLRRRSQSIGPLAVLAVCLMSGDVGFAQCAAGGGGGGTGGPRGGGGAALAGGAPGGAAFDGGGATLAQMQQMASLMQQQAFVRQQQAAAFQQRPVFHAPQNRPQTAARSLSGRNDFVEAAQRRREATLRMSRARQGEMLTNVIAQRTP